MKLLDRAVIRLAMIKPWFTLADAREACSRAKDDDEVQSVLDQLTTACMLQRRGGSYRLTNRLAAFDFLNGGGYITK